MAFRHRTIPVTPFQQNCSLVWCDDTLQAAVIDPGGVVQSQAIESPGGELRLVSNLRTSTFDKYNPFTIKGSAPAYLSGLMFEGLLAGSIDNRIRPYVRCARVELDAEGRGEVAFALLVATEALDQRRRLRMLARQLAKALHVGSDARIGQRGVEFGEAHGEALELLAEGVFHRNGPRRGGRRGRHAGNRANLA